VPLKPSRKAFNNALLNSHVQTQKIGRMLFLKTLLNMLGTPKCKRPKTFPKSP